MDVPRVINKPQLYHYTRPENIVKVLTSKALWARPTWNFADTDEYVHGLRLIESQLKQISAAHLERRVLPPPALELLTSYNVNPRRIFEDTIAHIEYELANYSKPNVEIYVACTTENSESKEMAAEYGGCAIRFNWMLPLLGYACPKPFHGSMLSRVSYNEQEFTAHIVPQAFVFGMAHLLPQMREFLSGKDHQSREAGIAATVATNLCVFAANLKKPRFAYEREWRLKTFKINHSIPTLYDPEEVRALRRVLKMSEIAEFTSDPPNRYVLDLRLENRMIIENVAVLASPPIDVPGFMDFLREVRENLQTGFWGPAIDQKEELLRLWAQPAASKP